MKEWYNGLCIIHSVGVDNSASNWGWPSGRSFRMNVASRSEFYHNEAKLSSPCLIALLFIFHSRSPRLVSPIFFLQPFIMYEWAFYAFTGKSAVQRMSWILFALQHVFIMKNRALIINSAFTLKEDILPSANADQQVKFLLFTFWRNGKETDLQSISCFSSSMIVFPIWKNIIHHSRN